MLPASFRLSGRQDINTLFRLGSSASVDALVLRWKQTHLPYSRAGFIAGKKIFSKAVDRNRAKRVLREAMRDELFQLRPGFDMIVVYRYKPKHLSYAESAKNLHSLLEKNNLLK